MAASLDLVRLKALLIEKVVLEFPGAEAIVLWGGVLNRPNEAMEHGDVDLLIVVPFDSGDAEQEHLVSSKLALLISTFGQEHNIELEPVAASPRDLRVAPLRFLFASGPYRANSVVQYLVKNESTVIYGDERVLDAVPQIGLKDALVKMSGLVLSRIDGLRAELRAADDSGRSAGPLGEASPQQLVATHFSSFVVFARTICSLRKGRTTSKLEALEYIGREYPEHARLMQLLAVLYRGKKPANDAPPGARTNTSDACDAVTRAEVLRFLDLVQDVVGQETGSQ